MSTDSDGILASSPTADAVTRAAATETTPLLINGDLTTPNSAASLHPPSSSTRPSSLRSVQLHNIAQRHRSHSPAPSIHRSNTNAAAAPHARRLFSGRSSNHHDSTNSTNNKPSASGGRRLRAKLLFALIAVLLAISVYASFVDDFMGDVEVAISCGTCIGLLLPLKALASVGDDAFVNFFVGWCTKLGIEDEDVCAGAVGTQAPILAHDLRSISLASHAAKNFCSTVFGLCPLQQVIPFEVKMQPPQRQDLILSGPNATMNGRPSDDHKNHSSGRKWRSRGRKPFQVVHLSDVHVDRQYVPGSNTICSKVICCRDYGAIDSTGPAVEKPAGRYGNKHCDAPVDLVESMLTAIKEIVPEKAFTIFTGDVVESAVWAVNESKVADDLHLWHGDLRDPESPSYPAFGNHDVAPVNAFPRSTTLLMHPNSSASHARAMASTQWVFELAAHDWRKWIGHDAARSVRDKYGCYSVLHPGTKLRIISLNTNYWYKQNFWLYDHDEPLWDPNGILTWLSNELHMTEMRGERAWIIGHMPFGKVDAMRDQSNYANQIFQRYHNVIAAHFYGHSHVDEFEIAYPDYHDRRAETANGIAYISGALTPASGNPVFRVYDVDPDTYEVMDFTPYYTNKSEPAFNVNPIWKPYYSARSSYGDLLDPPPGPLDSLNGSFWHRVTEVMERNDTIFQLFNTRLSRGGKVESCNGHVCKNNTICMLRSMRSESNCAVIRPGLSFKDRKRDTEAVTEPVRDEGEEAFAQSKQHDYFECEGPGLGSMLRKVAQMTTTTGTSAKGRFGINTVKEQPFALLKAFRAAAEAAVAEQEQFRLGEKVIGGTPGRISRIGEPPASLSSWSPSVSDSGDTWVLRLKRTLRAKIWHQGLGSAEASTK